MRLAAAVTCGRGCTSSSVRILEQALTADVERYDGQNDSSAMRTWCWSETHRLPRKAARDERRGLACLSALRVYFVSDRASASESTASARADTKATNSGSSVAGIRRPLSAYR